MKTIIIFTVNYDPWISGAELFVKEVVTRLRSEYRFLIITARQSRRVPRREMSEGVEIVRVGLGARFDKWLYPILAPIAAWRRPHDVVHAVMESYAGIALWIFKMFSRAPTLLTLQSGDLDDKAASGRIPAWLWKRIHRAPDTVTAISAFLAERAIRLRGSAEGVVVIPNGVDLKLVERIRDRDPLPVGRQVGYARDDKHSRIICVARLSPEKGLEYLLRAMPAVRSAAPHATLTIVGGGALDDQLKSLTRELGIESYVTLLGAKPHDEVMKEIQKSDVFVCPSIAEGLGIVFIEAQACGVPVVGTRVGGISDVIKDGVTGLLVPPKDSGAIANALVRLIQDPDLGRRLASEALRNIERYSWDKIAAEVGRWYQSKKIVFAAGLYPPAVGGPATFARDLVDEFHGSYHKIAVVRYGRGGVPQTGSVAMRYRRFARAVMRAARGAEAILAFDAVGSGIPAAIASLLTRTPLVIRVGGDYFWETASARTDAVVTFRQYWERGPRHSSLSYCLIKFALARARFVIFNSAMLLREYVRHGLVAAEKVHIITNSLPPLITHYQPAHQRGGLPISNLPTSEAGYQVLFAGRFIKLKNIPRLLEAISELRSYGSPVTLTLVGAGPEEAVLGSMARSMGLQEAVKILPPQTKEKLRDLMTTCAAVVIPSFSEMSPQLVGESFAVGTPVIITREHGLPAALRPLLFEIDPGSSADIAAKIASALSPVTRDLWQKRLSGEYQPRTMREVAGEIMQVIEGIRRVRLLQVDGLGWWKRAVKSMIYSAASPQALWYRRPRVAILLYHDVGYNGLYLTVRPEALLSQIRKLKSWGFEFLSMQDLVGRLWATSPLPSRAVVLTFDDGTRGQYEHAYQICREENVPATFFVTTGWIGGACAYTQGKVPAITSEQLRLMQEHPLIAIEPHGVTHRHFDAMSDDEARRELIESRRAIGGKIFAYPAGKFLDHQKEIVSACGYDAAVGVRQELIRVCVRQEDGAGIDLFNLPRITVDSGLPISGLCAATLPWGIRILRIMRPASSLGSIQKL